MAAGFTARTMAGLIDCERRGTWVYYWVLPGVLDRLALVLKTPSPPLSLPPSPQAAGALA